MAKIETFHKVVNALLRFNSIKTDAAAKIAVIMADDMHSVEYNNAAAVKMREAAMNNLAAIRDELDELLPVLAAEVYADRPRLDLTDPRLQSAIALISAGGAAGIGADAQASIIEPFSNNHEALTALMPLLEKSQMTFAAQAAEQAMHRLTRASGFMDSLSDELYYSSQSLDAPWNAEKVLGNARNYAELNGLTMPAEGSAE